MWVESVLVVGDQILDAAELDGWALDGRRVRPGRAAHAAGTRHRHRRSGQLRCV